MAVGAGTQQPVVVNGAVEIKTVMKVTLSTDHRTVDGAVGAEFLQYFKRYIENPVSMLV
jgi:pyruvate dehydrogenase E2 component (dihydrolipoamide acetyltransferase)